MTKTLSTTSFQSTDKKNRDIRYILEERKEKKNKCKFMMHKPRKLDYDVGRSEAQETESDNIFMTQPSTALKPGKDEVAYLKKQLYDNLRCETVMNASASKKFQATNNQPFFTPRSNGHADKNQNTLINLKILSNLKSQREFSSLKARFLFSPTSTNNEDTRKRTFSTKLVQRMTVDPKTDSMTINDNNIIREKKYHSYILQQLTKSLSTSLSGLSNKLFANDLVSLH